MAQGTTTFNDISPAAEPWFIRTLLDRAKKDQVYRLFAEKATIPKHESDKVRWRRYDPYPTVKTPRTDGVVGKARKPTYQDITAQLESYGDYTKMTKRVVGFNLENITMEVVDIHGQQAGETFDELMGDVLYSGASFINASNGVNGGTPTEVTFEDVESAVIRLRTNSAKMITPTIEASTKIGTNPVAKSYFAFFPTEIRDDIRAMDDFQPYQTYAMQKPVYQNEFGAVGNVRFIETNNGQVNSSVYSIFIVAEKAYGEADLSGEGFHVYRHGFGSAGTEDPYSEFMTIGWDGYWVGTILNDNWMVDLRVTHS